MKERFHIFKCIIMTTVNIHDVRVNRINNILQNYLKQNIFLPLYGFSIVYFELQYR